MVSDPVIVGMTLDDADKAVEEAMKYCADGTYVFRFGEIVADYPDDPAKQASWRIPVKVIRAISEGVEQFVDNSGMIFAPIPPCEKKRRMEILVELSKGASQQLGLEIWSGNAINIEQLEDQEMVGTISWIAIPRGSKNFFSNYKFTDQKVE